jgi:hypothetical protein
LLPEALRQPIYAEVGRRSLSWEKVLLDLHTERLFGSEGGVWIVNIVGILRLFQRLDNQRPSKDLSP